jgi:alpha-beta hydrolase superfamily lysophospholipase
VNGPRAAVLHVHGYNDYFFQDHLARAFADAGYAFYAVDLRGAGRSWRPDQVPHYVDDLQEQATDVAQAASAVRAEHPDLPLVVHAHSTGGLTASLWAHAHRHATGAAAGPEALVLDAPFLDLPGSPLVRGVGTRVLDTLGPLSPLSPVRRERSWYSTHLLADNGGRWTFDPRLKRPEGLPVRVGWMRAVRRAQARVARGLAISCPVLVAVSASSGPDAADNPHLDAQDTVLDVDQIVRVAPRLGKDVTLLRVRDGVHDLSLSADVPRRAYLAGVLQWLDARLPRPATSDEAAA